MATTVHYNMLRNHLQHMSPNDVPDGLHGFLECETVEDMAVLRGITPSQVCKLASQYYTDFAYYENWYIVMSTKLRELLDEHTGGYMSFNHIYIVWSSGEDIVGVGTVRRTEFNQVMRSFDTRYMLECEHIKYTGKTLPHSIALKDACTCVYGAEVTKHFRSTEDKVLPPVDAYTHYQMLYDMAVLNDWEPILAYQTIAERSRITGESIASIDSWAKHKYQALGCDNMWWRVLPEGLQELLKSRSHGETLLETFYDICNGYNTPPNQELQKWYNKLDVNFLFQCTCKTMHISGDLGAWSTCDLRFLLLRETTNRALEEMTLEEQLRCSHYILSLESEITNGK